MHQGVLSKGHRKAAILTNRQLKIGFVGRFRAVYFFPNLVTIASLAILVCAILDWQHGSLSQFLFRTSQAAREKYIFWLNNPHLSRTAFSLIQTWMWFGYIMILFMAGIQGIPRHFFEAAIVDGALGWKVFSLITLPLLRSVFSISGHYLRSRFPDRKASGAP